MNGSSVTLTVYFEEPFWVGVWERIEDGRLSVCKVTFGAEPKENEVWDFILHHYDELRFSPAVETEERRAADNPKRRQRMAKKQLQNAGIGTKSQQTLAAQREEQKGERQQADKEQKKAEQQRQFAIKQQKRREKHRGH